MKRLAFAFALLSFGCSNSKDPGTEQQADTGAPDVCVAFDAGPKGMPSVPPDTMGTDEDAAVDSAPPTADSGPVVTKAEIDDIFKLSCSFSSCHGSKPGKGNLYIPGPPGNWYTNVVDVPSTTLPTMKRIVPYDPQNSFLVHKLSDGLCALTAQCVDKNCGDRMPQANDPLDPVDRDKIIEWIRQGAKEL
ncbi:MAG: hypothetical protein ACXVEE_12710 [Polyangiales bacterium]